MSESLLTIIPDLQVTPDEVREGEAFAQDYLSAAFPNVDFRPGLAAYDMVIRPNGTMLAVINKAVAVLLNNNTISSVTDSTLETTVDKLMSNWFLTRRTGESSVIVARLYLLQRKNVYLSTSYYFSTDNERLFYPRVDRTYTADTLQASSSPSAIAPFYLDVEMEAASASSDFDIESGTLLYFSTFDPFFVGGEIVYLKSRAIPRETNTEFVARGETAISTRNLINEPSIIERVTSVFAYIDHVQPVGHGDEEMIRDIRTVLNPISNIASIIHLGGMVDVYVNAPLGQVNHVPVKVEMRNGELGFYLTGPVLSFETTSAPETAPEGVTPENGYVTALAGRPMWNIESTPVKFTGYDNAGNVIGGDYSLDNGFSTKQKAFVKLPTAFSIVDDSGVLLSEEPVEAGMYFYVNTRAFQGITSIQSYLDDRLKRVLVADYLARAMDVYELNFVINTFGSTTPEDPARLYPYIESYVSNMNNGETFEMADLISILKTDAGISNLSVPVSVTYTRYQRNGQVTYSGEITNVHSIDRLSRFEVGSILTGLVNVQV